MYNIEHERSQRLSLWGLNSHVIQYVLDIRILEDLIDLAQRHKMRPDATIEREMYLMKYLYYQNQKDLNVFLE